MVGRKVILKVDKGAAHPGEVVLEARDLAVRDDRGVDARRGCLVQLARGRDRRHRRRRRQRPVGTARGAGRHPPARGGRDPRQRRRAAAPPSAIRKGMRALGIGHVPGGPPSRRPRHAVRGLRKRDARLPGRAGLRRAACCSTARRSSPTRRRKMEAYDIRPRAPLLKTANFSGGNQQKIVLAREIERNPRGHPGRPADARRRHRRDRIHPQAHRRAARRRQGGAAGVGRTRRDFRAVRPHPRALRGPDHRRAQARGRPTRRTSAC